MTEDGSPGTRPRLLLVTSSTSYRTTAFLDAGHHIGCDVVVATDSPAAIPGTSLDVSFEHPAIAAEQLIASAGSIDAAVGTDGGAVRVAAAVTERLGRPSNPAAAIDITENKYLQRVAAEPAGIRQPAFGLLPAGGDGDTGEMEQTWPLFPAVLKPLDRSASQGVLRVDDLHELVAGAQLLRQIVGADAALVVEQFVSGTEVSVEGLLRDGRLEVIGMFDKPDAPQGPTFPETILVRPARLTADERAAVVEVAERVTTSIGLCEGPVHVEAKVDGDCIWFLEVAARTIGGLCARALDHGGLTLEELVVRHALDMPVPAASDRGATGVLMLPVEQSGRLMGVHGIDRARAIGGVTDVVVSISAGQDVLALPAGDRYLGFVFARADTPDEVENALRLAWAELEVDITAS